MAQRIKKLEEWISLTGETTKVLSYADYFSNRPLFSTLKIKNTGGESVNDLTLCVTNENGMLISFEKVIEEIPFESVVEVEVGGILSPYYFSNIEEVKTERIEAVVYKNDKKVIARKEWEITALPFDYWEGLEGNAELLATFVRPKLGDCAKLQTEISTQLKKWASGSEISGYIGNDKNAIRRILASLFACIRRKSFNKNEQDLSKPVIAGAGIKLLSQSSATPLELALFSCACLESMGLHSVLAVGKKSVACGVWLYDSCFLDTTCDDMQRLCAYAKDGINNVSLFDVEDLFADTNFAFSTSEKHFIEKCEKGEYDVYVDVARCRIAHILPMPMRAKSVKGYEVLSQEETSPDALPADLRERKDLSLNSEQTKDKQWERRLLDLSMKNSLLHFSGKKSVLHLLSADTDFLLSTLLSKGELVLSPATPDLQSLNKEDLYFGTQNKIKHLRQLIELENNNGILRTYLDEKSLQETVNRLIRKNKEANEESGAKILYLALGFLKWFEKANGECHYAPLILQPVTLKRSKGGKGYAVAINEEDISLNDTLLEYLKEEFNIDIRGLSGMIQGLKIAEILAMIRMETVQMRGWEVYDEAYIATFSFARYQMWNDLRSNIEEFSKNSIVRALLDNSFVALKDDKVFEEDSARPETTLTPLPADASQWNAIALSQTGTSFVLHGPPGTGKSQTITNIIANALYEGKTVLFVAEKQAALSVVKKRLDGLGLGDFSLELHSNKANKTDVLQKLTATLSLAQGIEHVNLTDKAGSIFNLKNDLNEPLIALHKKRRLGVSIYEAILTCLKYKNSPDIMNIESSFYDGLTKEKIAEYEQMMVQAAAAAKECGGVYKSPFANVNLTEYNITVRDSVYCAAEVLIAEIKHLKNYVALFLDLYRQKISTFTRKKLDAIYEIASILSSGVLNKYFKENEEEFYTFFNANRRLDVCLDKYFTTQSKWIDVAKEYVELGKWLEEGGSDYKGNKYVKSVVKKLEKTSILPMPDEEIFIRLQNVYDIYQAMDRIKTSTKLAQYFTRAFGKVEFFETRRHFMSQLYHLHDLCKSVFMDYNPDSFNSMCIRASSGYSSPALVGLMRCIESFNAAEESFSTVTNADKSKIYQEDVLEYNTSKASALIENIDMLAPWCMYKKTAEALIQSGLTFMTDALENGAVTSENIIGSFEKNIYKNYLQTNIPLDPVLSKFSAGVLEEKAESLRVTLDEFSRLTKDAIYEKLISRLPTASTEGALSLEVANFNRLSKANLRGMGLRKLFEETPELMQRIAPCMLMSPMTVSQYLQPQNGLFDLVIFDEASQIPTAEAISSLARAKTAIIVGDPKQLPPNTFFHTHYVDEENLENEDMESFLDDCLAINLPQRHLTWHYRSKHESLIAFSNVAYYDNRLCTFPSPDALNSKVKFNLVEDGVYDRGLSKKNKAEGDALIEEVLRRLQDATLKKSSIGIVTFSSVQQEYIENRLSAMIIERKLEREAYDREEPLFVKNLENVQGDERDVILFSICYGPDKYGKISLNFGPLNQAGGWRRLNVAVSRAREEMVVFSSMTGAMIDLSKTNSKGVAGLKAFLEFAEKGRTNLAISSNNLIVKKSNIGKYIAQELNAYGYECRYDVGVSNFKIDVAVVDPKNRHKFILAILCDTPNHFSVKDRNVLQIQTLKRNNWNVLRLFAVNYYNNPKREIKKIKDYLDKLTGADKKGGTELNRGKKAYKSAVLAQRIENATYVTCGENDKEIIARLKNIVAVEEPIAQSFLIRRCLNSLGITKYGAKVETHMQALIGLCGFKMERILGEDFYHKTDKNIGYDKYRVENGEQLRKNEHDYSPYEVLAVIRAALEDKVALFVDEIQTVVASVFKLAKPGVKFENYVNDCISLGEDKGLFIRSVSDRISLA